MWTIYAPKLAQWLELWIESVTLLTSKLSHQFTTPSQINSHLSYLAPVWENSATDILLNSLQVVQNQALRTLFRIDYYANGLSTDEIGKKPKILSVRQNIRYNTAMLAYKVKRGQIKTNIEINTINNIHICPTRNALNL